MGAVRVNISVSADLRRWMLRYAQNNKVNWSEIAAIAFEQLMMNEPQQQPEPPDCRP